MRIDKAYKTKLIVNNKEDGLLRQMAGVARFVYNWGLTACIELGREQRYLPSAKNEVKALFNAIKDEECPWVRTYSYKILECAFDDLEAAFKRYRDMRKAGDVRRKYAELTQAGRIGRYLQKKEEAGLMGHERDPYFPRRKRRTDNSMSFGFNTGVKITATHIILPGSKAAPPLQLRLAERSYIPVKGVKHGKVTISWYAGNWYVSVGTSCEVDDPEGLTGSAGVDVGILKLAVFSDGQEFGNPKALGKYLDRLRKQGRRLSRMIEESKKRHDGRVVFSNNMDKLVQQIRATHAKIANVRNDAQHKASKHVLKLGAKRVVIETLNIKGMVKNRRLARALSDASLADMQRKISYKAVWAGATVEKADRWFPSSKTCNACGAVNAALSLSDRVYICTDCGNIDDRDGNAAKNLAAYGLK